MDELQGKDSPLDYLRFFVRPTSDFPDEMETLEILVKLFNKNTIPLNGRVDIGITATLAFFDGGKVIDVRYESLTDTYSPISEDEHVAPAASELAESLSIEYALALNERINRQIQRMRPHKRVVVGDLKVNKGYSYAQIIRLPALGNPNTSEFEVYAHCKSITGIPMSFYHGQRLADGLDIYTSRVIADGVVVHDEKFDFPDE